MTSISECSNHCGPGVQTVTSRCVQVLLDSTHPPRPLPAHACLHIEKPSEHQSCVGPCDDAHWSYSEWNTCSVSCGGGVQFRSAKCVDSNERQVRDENCARQEKHLKRICSQEACPRWDLGEWSPVIFVYYIRCEAYKTWHISLSYNIYFRETSLKYKL